MSTVTKDRESTKRLSDREQELRKLFGSAALELAAKNAKSAYVGLCRECSNREICRKRKAGEFVASCASHKPGPPISANAFKSFEQVLDFAMAKADTSYAFFKEMARTAGAASTRKAFKGFAKQSLVHRKRLAKMKHNGAAAISPKNVRSLQLTKYVTKGVEATREMDTREAMLLAIKTADATQMLYADLAAQAEDAKIQEIFSALAQEEAEQKLKLETEYDERVFVQG
jgi:rubrerythrin